MDNLMELRVRMRDLTTHTEVGDFNQIAWVDRYNEHLATAMQMWLSTFGGTILLTGTPEQGRVTVYRKHTDRHPIMDTEWWTDTVDH